MWILDFFDPGIRSFSLRSKALYSRGKRDRIFKMAKISVTVINCSETAKVLDRLFMLRSCEV